MLKKPWYQRWSNIQDERGFAEKEKNVVSQLGHCVNVTQSLCCVAVPAGPCTEAVFRLLSRSYTVLTALTKYFTSKCSPQCVDYQHARFGKLVKLAGFPSLQPSGRSNSFMSRQELGKDTKDKKVKEAQVLSQARKQAIYIPRLVSDLENFSKAVTLLSKKCKVSH
ncbi:Fanconi anemia group I protein homolog [Homalodisca vitripennis]|uniref:Fanconi anemia group I protein homolog n=1 Tax=Homalodisca vitripennis TaxID=197043 RepID=UPI001EEC908D|nr:Fanconi anemia group I protein homolog [Homalodisca vitripennis]